MSAGAPSLLLGRLDWQALVFLRAWREPSASSLVAAVAGGIAVLATLWVMAVLTRRGWWRPLWRDWLTSLDHKRIGIMYVVLALVMLVRAVLEAVLMRAQQAVATGGPGFLAPEHFAELFSTHGTIMIFFMAMPFLSGVLNYVVPLQIGAREVSFPLLNAISLALTAAGAWLVMAALVLGHFSTGGWTGYPPYTALAFNPGEGVDYWIWAVTLSSLGSTLTGINLAVTIYKARAPGMRLMRMPLFCWTALCTAILMIFAMMPLTLATLMLALDRQAGFHFFTAGEGGNLMLYANLFWLFGHPEVYILILPAFGIWSEVIPTFAGKRLYGYRSLVLATMAIAVLSFTVWLHHLFTMGQSAALNAVFGVATMLIGVPTGVKVYDWLLTLYRGRIRLTVPMLFAVAFLVTFVIGGISGVMLANPTVDYAAHNSLFLVAHFHNMLIPGLLFGMIAGVQFWFPKAFGFRLDERWGRIACGLWVAGFYLAFMPLYPLGLMGAMRRTPEWGEAALRPWFALALAGAALMLAGLASLGQQLRVSLRARARLAVPAGDPWDGRSLEWSLPAPPPDYNFAVLPKVTGRDAFWQAKRAGRAYAPPEAGYEDIELPANSPVAPLVGICAALTGFALVWQIWWLAVAGLCAGWAVVALRSFARDTTRVIPAAQVAAMEDARRALLARIAPVGRAGECGPANRGRAAVEDGGR